MWDGDLGCFAACRCGSKGMGVELRVERGRESSRTLPSCRSETVHDIVCTTTASNILLARLIE